MKNPIFGGFMPPIESLKFDLKMRLTVLLLIVSLVTSYASTSYSQNTKISLELEDVTIEKLLSEIESLSDFRFFYNNRKIDTQRRVTVKVENTAISDILESVFEGTDISFKVKRKHIIFKTRESKSIREKPVAPPVGQLPIRGTVSGTVSDKDGPLPGVNILVKGTNKGVVTDFDGNYTIDDVSDDDFLVFSFIGYQSQEIRVAGQSTINVTLIEDIAKLGEIVVIGYGSAKKKDLTGAIASISEEDFQNSTRTSVDQMLQGKVAGVRISQTSGQPGGGVSIRIRGNSSLNTGNEPLYVIDGMPIDNAPLLGGSGANIPSSDQPNPLNTINPNDIESIQVLKDASATAIYGARGANGVILITTKSGKTGKLKIDYSTSVGVQSIARKIDLLNSAQYVDHIGDILTESGSSLLPEFTDTSVDTDWQDEIYEDAMMMQHNIAFSGGNQTNTFYSSLNYTSQDGILKGSGFERFGARLNWKHDQDRFSFSANINTSLTQDDITAHGGGGNFDAGAISTAIFLPGTAPVRNADGSFFLPETLDLDNPYNIIQGIDIQGRTHRTLINLKGEYDIVENITASLALNTDVINTKTDSYRSRRTIVGGQAGGIANVLTAKSTNYTVDALLNYNNTFAGEHTLSALAGYTYQKFNYQFFSGNARGFIGDEVGTNDLGSGDRELNNLSTSRSEEALLSFLSRVNYSYQDRFLFTASYRVDGSSKFLEGEKYNGYPSFSMGYRISEENFMRSLGFVSNLKARVGWGQIGNARIPNNAVLASFITGDPAVFNDQLIPGLTPARIPNPGLTWETTEQLNIGLDFGLFEGKVWGALDFYNKKTKDLLFQQPVPLQTGFATQWVNLPNSEITNTGLELSLNSINIRNDVFSWESNLNLTTNKNEITDLNNEEIIISSDVIASVANIEGEAAFSYFGLESLGIWQAGEDPSGSAQPGAVPGQPKWKDQNGDDVINAEDRVILGNPYPEFIWGFTNTFAYKGLELSVFLEGVHGVDLYSNLLANSYFPFNNSRNRVAEPILNRWTVDNPTNEWPSFVDPSSYGGDLTNEYTIQDASFIRLRNVTLRYNFNVANLKLINSLSAYVSGENLAIITDYIGYDPDLSGSGNSRLDFNSYPTSRTILLGFNIGL